MQIHVHNLDPADPTPINDIARALESEPESFTPDKLRALASLLYSVHDELENYENQLEELAEERDELAAERNELTEERDDIAKERDEMAEDLAELTANGES